MFLIFRPELATSTDPSGARITLSDAETHHARARRLHDGDPIFVGDGRRRRWFGSLRQRQIVNLQFDRELEEGVRILCSAIPEGNRRDWLLARATELGLTHFLPVVCERSGPQRMDAERFGRLVEEAAAQSRRFFLPVLLPSCRLPELVQWINEQRPLLPDAVVADTTWLVLHPAGRERAEIHSDPVSRPYVFVVGPEGGFSPAEIDLFAGSPVKICSLGPRILRIETACLALLARFPGS
ncbi:MAG: 16S rRNA (uracil(1498)-N(3))-methyltransferase [Spirochaetales bacterium]|nr:16S rRNA (uracil(1498)-N(3))-methyltransferase [Spirochaetales bacterium]